MGNDLKVNHDIRENINQIILKTYPVGSVYISFNNKSPQTLFGGTWEQLVNEYIWKRIS